MKEIMCNWCGKPHAQPSQSALQALATCCKYNRYAGAMPDSFFKTLSPKEEREFRQWAHDHYSLTLPDNFSMFHPVIRDEWRKIEN